MKESKIDRPENHFSSLFIPIFSFSSPPSFFLSLSLPSLFNFSNSLNEERERESKRERKRKRNSFLCSSSPLWCEWKNSDSERERVSLNFVLLSEIWYFLPSPSLSLEKSPSCLPRFMDRGEEERMSMGRNEGERERGEDGQKRSVSLAN